MCRQQPARVPRPGSRPGRRGSRGAGVGVAGNYPSCPRGIGFRPAGGVVVPVGGVAGVRAGRSVVGGFAVPALAVGFALRFGVGVVPGFVAVGPWAHHPDLIVASHSIAGIRPGPECIAVACRFVVAAPAGVAAHHRFGGVAAPAVAAVVVAVVLAAWPPRGLGWADHNDLP